MPGVIYRNSHRSVSASLLRTEYAELERITRAQKSNPTAFATQAVRDAIATAKEAEALFPSLVPAGSE